MRKGEKASEKVRKRISESAKKRKINWTPEMRKRRSEIAIESNTGRILSKESKQKISRTLTGHKDSLKTRIKKSNGHKGLYIGELNPQWKGGISNHPPDLSDELRFKIKARDGFKCQNENCSGKSKNIDIHHIDKNEWNNSEENIITLCRSCHKLLHTREDFKIKRC